MANDDCNGVNNGTAYLDACGICVGGNTGLSPCVITDCNGTVDGTAYFDSCGNCVGGTTNESPCPTLDIFTHRDMKSTGNIQMGTGPSHSIGWAVGYDPTTNDNIAYEKFENRGMIDNYNFNIGVSNQMGQGIDSNNLIFFHQYLLDPTHNPPLLTENNLSLSNLIVSELSSSYNVADHDHVGIHVSGQDAPLGISGATFVQKISYARGNYLMDDHMMDWVYDTGSGNGGSGKIVCSMMNEFYGTPPVMNKIWLKHSTTMKNPEIYALGYHTIFLPLVAFAKKEGRANTLVRLILEHIALHRTIDLHKELNKEQRHILGATYRFILEPLCYLVGLIHKKWQS